MSIAEQAYNNYNNSHGEDDEEEDEDEEYGEESDSFFSMSFGCSDVRMHAFGKRDGDLIPVPTKLAPCRRAWLVIYITTYQQWLPNRLISRIATGDSQSLCSLHAAFDTTQDLLADPDEKIRENRYRKFFSTAGHMKITDSEDDYVSIQRQVLNPDILLKCIFYVNNFVVDAARKAMARDFKEMIVVMQINAPPRRWRKIEVDLAMMKCIDKSAPREDIEKTGNDDHGDYKCSICMDAEEEICDAHPKIIRTRCSHVYHESCLQNWLRINFTCPLCRSNLASRRTNLRVVVTLPSHICARELRDAFIPIFTHRLN